MQLWCNLCFIIILTMNQNEINLDCMNFYIQTIQFSEEFLINTIDHYDPYICFRKQTNLSPDFCFKYVYNQECFGSDKWINYDDILEYFKYNGNYTEQDIINSYNKQL
jgi:hypothetical protein